MADQYFLKALDSYPYNLEFVIEALSYALSYDDEHAQSNCLMGRIQMEHLKNYERAECYFVESLLSDINYVETYKYFSLLKIWKGDYSGALKLIDHGMTIPGIDKALLRQRKAMVYEFSGRYKAAQIELKRALHTAHNDHYTIYFKNELSRLKKKMKRIKLTV